MKLFLGVDGGQSGTTALIGDETGRVLGSGEAGPCNHAGASEGRARLERAMTESLAAACRAAGLDAAALEFSAACFGMSGGPEDKREILARIVQAKRWIVTHDAATALAGATADGHGIVTIAGTGSIAYGRSPDGRDARTGGWGYIFGDEGSAFDIARQALRAALRMEEGWGPATVLRDALLEATGAENANDVLHRFYTPEWPRSRVATLAPQVDAAALAGDSVADQILAGAAQQLAMLAVSVRDQLWRPGDPVEVAYIGGVFESGRVRERFRMLVELEAGSRCRPPRHDPSAGALLAAYRAEGLNPELRW
ncbi:MAG TPA: BadF/BadG/BcrA/BcrD ATPase family protein [Bryobacteraceae bacterium]|nr:BadF/BadG/BcrA/BcrD ATPase family protein [Bryobacteraceae bacterium]